MTQNMFAAIDLGSNSFHMVIASLENGELKVIDRIKEMVRLADGLDETEMLTEKVMKKALQALSRFGERLRHVPQKNVRVVGTNTLRKAKNSRQFLKKAIASLGHDIEIVAGQEEARLVYFGVANSIDSGNEKRLVIDIGGGSTELIIGTGFDPIMRESKYMGCVNFTKKYFEKGIISEENFRNAEIAAKQELRSSVGKFTSLGWVDVIGASGTIKSTQNILDINGWGKQEITLKGLKSIRSALIFSGKIKKIQLEGLSPDRYPVYCGGLAILISLFESLKIEKMTASDGAMREGILYDLIGRHENRDIRDNTIDVLMARHQVDVPQAERVKKTAEDIFEKLKGPWQLDEKRFLRILRWSAKIHEIGLSIAHSNFHKHGSYLVENSDLPGFSRQEQKVFWALIRSHRRRIKPHRFIDLSSSYASVGIYLAVILRLAVLLHRSREDARPLIECSADPTHLKLKFPSGFLKANPLTKADLENEKNYLEEVGISFSY